LTFEFNVVKIPETSLSVIRILKSATELVSHSSINIKLFILFLSIFSLSCSQSQGDQMSTDTSGSVVTDTSTQAQTSFRQTQTTDTNNLRVYVDKAGNIIVNGQGSSLADLDDQFKTLKSKNGIVYYSRDNVPGDPPQQSMQVMELVTKYELPVKFYTDKTFTKVVRIN
jgi:biopolymer transport protein ExbD